jgi:hypothetical protein
VLTGRSLRRLRRLRFNPALSVEFLHLNCASSLRMSPRLMFSRSRPFVLVHFISSSLRIANGCTVCRNGGKRYQTSMNIFKSFLLYSVGYPILSFVKLVFASIPRVMIYNESFSHTVGRDE